jgi:YggT family protein
MSSALAVLEFAVRTIVVIALLYACLVALTHWAVRTRRLNAFGAWPRLIRRTSDPLLNPLERRIVRAGSSPQDAPLWLIGIVILGGLILLSLTRWLLGAIFQLQDLASAGPRAWLHAVIGISFSVVMAALFIRVVASWFSISRYRRWMRPVFVLTDWLVEPIHRVLPPVGMFDLSPLVAWLILWVVRGFLLCLF